MSLTTLGSEPQPSLAWTFESSNVDYVTNLAPSSQVSPGPAQLQGSAALVTNAPTSNTAVYFPGTSGSYMLLNSTPATFDLATSNLFVECWVYFGNVPINPNFTCIVADGPTGSGGGQECWFLRFNSSRVQFTINANTPKTAELLFTFSTSQWYHISASYNSGGSIGYVSVNGGTPNSVSAVTPKTSTGAALTIGAYPSPSSGIYMNGYIRDLRVVQGGIVPTTSFTPAAAPFSYDLPSYVTGSGSTVFTLLGQFITYNPSGKFGSSIVLLNPKVGGSSNVANTSVQWTTTQTSNAMTGVTISYWINFYAIPPNDVNLRGLIFKYGDLYTTTYGTSLSQGMYDGSEYPGAVNTFNPTVGTWYHLTHVYGNGLITSYVNGSQLGSSAGFAQARTITNSVLRIASETFLTFPSSFQMDDLRIYNTALTAAQVQSIYTQGGAPASSFRSTPQPTLAWDFDATSTEYVTGLTGTTTGTVSFENAKFNNGIRISNLGGLSSNYVAWTTKSSFNIDTGTSVFCWIKFNDLSNLAQIQTFLGTGGTNVFKFQVSTNGLLQCQLQDSVSNKNVNMFTPVPGTWYHVGAVLSNGTLQTYRDGLPSGSTSYVQSGITLSNILRIGIAPNFSGFPVKDVTMDDLRIYSSALNAAQVQTIYQAQGMPSRGVQVKTPIQPGYVYEPYNNYTIIGNPDVKVINSSNPDPRIYVDPAGSPYAQWTSDPNLLTKWDSMPFKYYILLGTGFSGTATNGLRFPVYVPTTTTYNVQILVYGAGANTDSLWIAMDGEVAIVLSYVNLTPTWRTGLASKSLTAGNHTLELYLREPYGIGGIRVIPTGGTDPTLTAFRQNLTGTPLFSQLSQAATSSAVGAFSLRAVNGTSAKAVQVRNGTTSATADFYADRLGNLLTAPVTGQTLANWLGGATGYVTTWYDQSGRGNHATQSTAANQPIIQRATKGPGYMCLYSGAQGLTFGAYNLLNNTNYTTCGVVRRTAVPAGTNYYLCGNGGVNAQDQKFHSGYRTSTQLTLAHYSDDANLTVPAFLTSTTEPTAYNYLMVGTGLSGRLYSYSAGTLYSGTRTYIGYLNQAIGSSFSIGGGFGSFTGEIYEILVFTQSLYDLDGTTSINQIYQNQLAYTGT